MRTYYHAVLMLTFMVVVPFIVGFLAHIAAL